MGNDTQTTPLSHPSSCYGVAIKRDHLPSQLQQILNLTILHFEEFVDVRFYFSFCSKLSCTKISFTNRTPCKRKQKQGAARAICQNETVKSIGSLFSFLIS